MKRTLPQHLYKIALIAVLCVICLMLFCACNTQDDTQDDNVERELYVQGIAFSQPQEEATDEEPIAYVYLTFVETDKKIEGVYANWSSQKGEEDLWYSTSHTHIDVDGVSLFSAVTDSIPQEKLVFEGVEYNRLKVIIRYDTIYKSIKSDGEIQVAGRTYSHYFTLDESAQSQRFTLSLTSAKSANWYSALLACAIVLFVLATVVYLIAKGKLWQKKKTRE